EAVALHLVDGAAVDSLIWQYDDDTAPRFTSKTKVIVKSEPFGIPPVVVSAGLSPEMKKKLLDIMLKMDLDAKGRAILSNVKIDRFIEIEDSAYDSIREMEKFIGEKQKKD
ncbi:MAG: PhnD/SsuA/transferrin family substrate-binding protein, partial [Nitrospirae bacterium]|nr:PhnD/SsuA/transferrin family substrate-binding protein [Nitrospirota bacterium]